MRRKLRQVEIARGLGISASMVSRLKRRGMPVHSVPAAIEWRRLHLDVAQLAEQATRRGRAAQVPDAAPGEDLLDDGSLALEHVALLAAAAATDFATWGERLRAEMAALPRARWDEVALPAHLWEQLGGESFRLLDAELAPSPGEEAVDSTDGDDGIVNDVVYQIAAGLMQVLPPGEGS